MNLLSIESSTSIRSVALQVGDHMIQRICEGGLKHQETLRSHIQLCFDQGGIKPHQLDGIIYGQGPGSFTGIRVACCLAQGISYALGVPLYTVSSLKLLAHRVIESGSLLDVTVVMDARLGQVYWGRYQSHEGRLVERVRDQVSDPCDVVNDPTTNWVGSGCHLLPFLVDQVPMTQSSDQPLDPIPQARDALTLMARLYDQVRVVKPIDASPNYCRNRVVHPKI